MQNSDVVQFKLCFLTFLTPPQVGEGGCFYRQSWSAMWVNWACFLECPRQQYRFPSGTLGCFQTLLVFSHSLQTHSAADYGEVMTWVWLRGLRCLLLKSDTAPSSPWIAPISLLSKQYCQLPGSQETTEVWPVHQLKHDLCFSVSHFIFTHCDMENLYLYLMIDYVAVHFKTPSDEETVFCCVSLIKQNIKCYRYMVKLIFCSFLL